MQISKLNKEVYAWGLALAIGISAFLIQPGIERDLSKTDTPDISIRSSEIEKPDVRWHTEESSAEGVLLDNSLTE